MYAVIRLKGEAHRTEGVESTLRMLRLNRRMHCVLLRDDDSAKGMLRKVKDNITWGEISDEVLKMMIARRGRIGQRRLTREEAEKAFADIKAGKRPSIKPVFRLTPPSKGFRKSIKQQYPDGEIGYRAEKINELLKRMI
ncbi:MAG: 50S ribosomal protein L30 [Candidatus Aenigmatarchaeota archaeon]